MIDRVPRFRRNRTVENLGLACALVLLILVPPSRASAAETIPWRSSYESALAEARAKGWPVWVQFSGPWCGYCRLMESSTFRTPEVIAHASDGVVPVKLNSDLRQDLVTAYRITGLPATVLLDPQGREKARYNGYLDPSQMLGVLLAHQGADTSPEQPPEPALGGICPVTLVKTGKLVKGSKHHRLTHDGLVLHLASDDAKRAFLNEPERYLPRNAGRCVVRQVDDQNQVPGDPRFGVYYQNRLYLCADADARQAFAARPQRYADADLGLAGQCPHCRQPGSTRYPLTVQGRRYLFPNPSHRQAFQANPDRFLR